MEFSKQCVVRCANGGSLMRKGREPSAPAITELRHELEYEPDSRPLFWLSYPTTGGKRRSPEYGARMEFGYHQLFPDSYQLCKLADLWEQNFPMLPAWETDGIHPKEHFAL